MGCGVGGTHHLRKGQWGAKDARPYCGSDQLGYMFDLEAFDRWEADGGACRACRIAYDHNIDCEKYVKENTDAGCEREDIEV